MMILLGILLWAALKILLPLVMVIAVITWIVIAIVTSIKVNRQFDIADKGLKEMMKDTEKFDKEWHDKFDSKLW